MDISNKKNKELINEELKVQIITKYIQGIVDNNDIENIKDQLYKMTISINELIQVAKTDRLYYLVLSLLNNILSINPNVKDSTIALLDNEAYCGINNVIFEKKALIVLKKYINYIKKFKDYNNLSLIVEILFYINSLTEIRKLNIKNANNIWNCAISNISYIPAYESHINETNKLKQKIESGIQKLKK